MNSVDGFSVKAKPPLCEFTPETTFAIENGADNFNELEPIYRSHYAEYKKRMSEIGVEVGPFGMRLDVYMPYWQNEYIVNFVARKQGSPVGYGNFYVTGDMHNGDLIAQEDAIYVLPEHRDGTGRKLALFVLDQLRKRGVKRLTIHAVTDPRASALWQRIGFRKAGEVLTYAF